MGVKSPAFLFYPESFIIGTRHMTDEEVGQYVRALCEQFFDGEINADFISNLSPSVQAKFTKNKNGKFYNKRLKSEIEKREQFVKSRKINGSKGGRPQKLMESEEEANENHMVLPSENHIRNRNINININTNNTLITSIVSYLNERIGTRYKTTTKKTRDCINARINEGYGFEDFKTVIDKKADEWLGDPKMSKYLRPETLFGNKFEGYLNQPTKTSVLNIDF